MNLCLSMVSSCPKHFVAFPEMKAVANSKDRHLKNGCKSTFPPLGKTFIKLVTGARKTSRSLNHFVAKEDCNARRDSFQCGPSWVKIPAPSSGTSAALLGATDQESQRRTAFKFFGSIVAYDVTPKKVCLRVPPTMLKYNVNKLLSQPSWFARRMSASRSSPRINEFDSTAGGPWRARLWRTLARWLFSHRGIWQDQGQHSYWNVTVIGISHVGNDHCYCNCVKQCRSFVTRDLSLWKRAVLYSSSHQSEII